jgi:hypothetical protein
VPLDGLATIDNATIGPVPATWPAAGAVCPSPAPILASTPKDLVLRTPTTAGDDYEYVLMWSRTGSSGLSGATALTFRIDVVVNTPPTLHVPSDLTLEATSAAGAVGTFAATATDGEDASPPTPTCSPVSGSTFPLGTTKVTCTAEDTGGLKDSGSFDVTVADTTAPVMPNQADVELTTADPDGIHYDYGTFPSFVEAVDPDPTVVCDPVSGSLFPVGTTTVTCTITDDAGNHSSTSFGVHVTYDPGTIWSAVWGEPVGASGTTFVANPGRTVPVKVEIFANGVKQTHGVAALAVATCSGAPVGTVAASWGGGRWNASLNTGALAGPGCYTVTATLDGQAAGSFRLDLRGDATAVKGPKGNGKP